MLGVGEYEGKVIDWGIAENKNGKLYAFIKLEDVDSGDSAVWSGYITTPENSKITIDTLVKVGFRGSALDDLEKSDALDTSMDVIFGVVTETYEGKEFTKVKWLRDKNSSQFSKLTGSDLQNKLKGMNLKGVIAKAVSEAPPREDDIPF